MSDVKASTSTVPDAVRIVEIRVHGVSNTPPAEMLEAEPEDIRRVDGDTLGSFWARKDNFTAQPTSVEAFSWGAQTRTGGGALAVAGRAIVHVGWFLLLPYALANLAYWTRRIPPQESGDDREWSGGVGAATVRVFGLVLTLIAVAAFCSVAIDLVAVQCFRKNDEQADLVCSNLPAVFDGMRALDVDSRAALLGLVPIAVVLVLYWIGRRGRVRFDAPIEKFGKDIGGQYEEGVPLLATRGFWAGARIRATSEWLHVAASILLVLFLLAFDAAFPEANCLGVPADTELMSCLGPPRVVPLGFALGSAAGIVVVGFFVVLASNTPKRDPEEQAPHRDPLRRWVHGRLHEKPEKRNARKRFHAWLCLIGAAAAYVAWLVLTSSSTFADANAAEPEFTGLIGTPIVLLVLALLLALAALGWRWDSRRRRTWSAVVLVLAGIALALSHLVRGEGVRWMLVATAVAFILAHLGICWRWRRPERRDSAATPGADGSTDADEFRFHAWRGQGAAVAMLLALFASMALSSLLVLGLAAWLGAPEAADTDRIWRTPGEPLSASEWNVPDAYERFAVVLTVIVALTVLLLVAVAFIAARRLAKFSLPALTWTSDAKKAGEDSFDERGGVDGYVDGYPEKLLDPEERTRIRAVSRRNSHLAHRGEPLFGWIAVFVVLGLLSLSSSAVFDWARSLLAEWTPGLPATVRSVSTSILVALAVAAVGAVVANAASSGERPLGVFWDVVAFFPRAGHPFAPPCFAERAVPELAEHTRAVLAAEDPDPAVAGDPTTAAARTPAPLPRRERAILLTAHSMGSTIAAATIMALRGERVGTGSRPGDLLTDRIALLSYGSQLRGYFSRFFPCVFGHRVLGVPGLRAPSLWSLDPWKRQVMAEFRDSSGRAVALPPPSCEKTTLTGMLGAHDRDVPRWRNLWRRTDYLGFPVFAYRDEGNPVDRGASETAAGYMWRVATHSDYLGIDQMTIERTQLAETLSPTPARAADIAED